MNGPPRYSYEHLRDQVNSELLKKDMPNNLYKSTDGIFRVVDSIIKTHGKDWAAQVLNNDGKPILTSQEQQSFTAAFEPYLDTIIHFFDNNTFKGGVYTAEQDTNVIGPDELYTKMIQKIGNINTVVNDYASKYGILQLEKEHDLEPDPHIIPEAAAAAISEGVFGLSTAAGFPIPPTITFNVLSNIKIPFRMIVFLIFLALDVIRIAMAVSDRPIARKLLSIVLSILELLRGDWKKATLTFIGFFGTTPLLAGEVVKIFLTLFRRLSPQLQSSILYGSFDATKSLIIGILLSIFQVTAPDEVRLPLISALEGIAKRKAELDGVLIEEGLSARPDYLSPTFEDLNNIQAVITDSAYICSCEFDKLIDTVNKSAIIKIILQILRIPVTKEYKELKCGTEPCKNFIHTVVKESLNETNKKPESTVMGGRILHSRLRKIIA